MIVKKKMIYIAAAALFALILAVPVLSAPAFAENGEYYVNSWVGLQSAINSSEEGDVINLSENLSPVDQSEGYILVPADKTVTIDLQGNEINRSLYDATEQGYAIRVEGNLTIRDSSDDQTGQITGGNNRCNNTLEDGGGICVYGGTLTLQSGTIVNNWLTGNYAKGGGVCIVNGGAFYMEGGVIRNNHVDGYNKGGGVGVANGQFVMTGGTIKDNIAPDAGGVLVGYGKCIMTGGVICDNIAQSAGGGVEVEYNATLVDYGFHMSGGSITGNHAYSAGGGVFVYTQGELCPMYVSGSPVVKDNIVGNEPDTEASNVVLQSAVPMEIEGALNEEAELHIQRIHTSFDERERTEIITNGLYENGTPDNFVSDSDSYLVGLTERGEAALCWPVEVTFDKGDSYAAGSMNPMTVPKDGAFTLPENGFTVPPEKRFAGWQIGSDTTHAYAPGNPAWVAGATTISAFWETCYSIEGAEVVLSNDTFTYNGKVQKPTVQTIGGKELTEGKDYDIFWPQKDLSNAGDYTLKIRGKGEYEGETEATYTIEEIPLTLKSASLSREYNGNALTNAEAADLGVAVNENGLLEEEGWIDNEGARYTFTGSVKNPGESVTNSYTIEPKKGTNLDNYNVTKIEGQLDVTNRTAPFEATVTANSYSGTYDGKNHTASGFAGDVEGKGTAVTANGHTYYVTGLTSEASGKDVSDSVESIPVTGTPAVKDADGTDVTEQFDITIVKGSLNIEKASLTLTSANLSKEYDGDALTNADAADLGVTVNENGLLVEDGWIEGEGATYEFTGSVKNPKENAANAFTVTAKSGTDLNNYAVTKTEGQLSITNRDAAFEVSVTANSYSGTYDGKTHTVSGFAGEQNGKIEVTANGKTYYVSGLTSEASGKNVSDSMSVIPVTGTWAVKEAGGQDVTRQFNVNIVNGALNISKAPLTLTSASLSKEYDGNALTNADAADLGVKVNENGLLVEDGWIEGEGAAYTFVGSVTNPGENGANAFFVAAKDGTDLGNYAVTKTEGQLSVTNREAKYEVTVTANSCNVVYDGKDHSVSGFTTDVEEGKTAVKANGKYYYVTGLTSEASGKNVSDSVASIPVTGTWAVEDSNGKDVTNQFNVTVVNGSLIIDKAENPVTVTGNTVTLKAKKLAKQKVVIKCKKAITISNDQGDLTFSKGEVVKKAFAKKVKVNKTTGNITVKKNVKKGTYVVTVNVKAAGNENYKAATEKSVVTINVK